MCSLGIGLYLSVIGVGSFLSSLVISAAHRASSHDRHPSWFAKDLNHSRQLHRRRRLDLSMRWLLPVLGTSTRPSRRSSTLCPAWTAAARSGKPPRGRVAVRGIPLAVAPRTPGTPCRGRQAQGLSQTPSSCGPLREIQTLENCAQRLAEVI